MMKTIFLFLFSFWKTPITIMTQPNEFVLSLEALSSQVSQEAFNPMAIPGAFSKLIGEVKTGFSGLFGFLDTKEKLETPLTSDQKKFIHLVGGMPYTVIGELPAFTPEGMKSNYIEFVKTLEIAAAFVQGVEKDVIGPYVMFLAQFISNAKIQHDTYTDKKKLDHLQKQVDSINASFSKHYGKASFSSRVKVKHVVSRNGDWKEVFDRLNKVVASLDKVNRKTIQSQIKQCGDYLNTIEKEFANSDDKLVSQEAAQRLAATAHTVAKMLELYSTVYFRALTLKGSVDNTIAAVDRAIG